MEITNICPYCGKEMRRGVLPAGRDSIRWYPCGEDGRVQNMWSSEGNILLSRAGLIAGQDAEAYHCEGCGVVIVPVSSENERKSGFTKALESLGESLDNWGSEREARQAAREEESAREKKEKERKRRGKKDPWEL